MFPVPAKPSRGISVNKNTSTNVTPLPRSTTQSLPNWSGDSPRVTPGSPTAGRANQGKIPQIIRVTRSHCSGLRWNCGHLHLLDRFITEVLKVGSQAPASASPEHLLEVKVSDSEVKVPDSPDQKVQRWAQQAVSTSSAGD